MHLQSAKTVGVFVLAGKLKNKQSQKFTKEEKKMAKYTFEEQVAFQVKKLIAGGKVAMHKFLGNGINIQNMAYKKSYATSKKEFTCECLLQCGFCTRECYQCKLNGAYLNALKEIDMGKRSKEDTLPITYIPTYGASKFHDNKGRTIIVMNFY